MSNKIKELIDRLRCPKIQSCPVDTNRLSCSQCRKSLHNDAAEALGIRAEHALALPGKCAPDTAGALIAQTVLTILQERGDLHDEPA